MDDIHSAFERVCGGSVGTFAVLCGAGVSRDADLPIAEDLAKALLTTIAPDAGAATRLQSLLTPRTDAPWLRFEGLLGVLQAHSDPDLRVLDRYRGGRVRDQHLLLAHYATNAPVLTTNFDGLIEYAAGALSTIPRAFYSEGDFAHAVAPDAGLYKLHGTLWKLAVGGSPLQVSTNDPDGPAATLNRISAVRHSKSRQAFLERIFRDYPVVVVGYSGSDDFDVSYWLRGMASLRGVFWVQYSPAVSPARFLTVDECAAAPEVEPGPRELAIRFSGDVRRYRFGVFLTATPLDELARLIPAQPPNRPALPSPPAVPPTSLAFSLTDQHLLTGALLSSVFRVDAAVPELEEAYRLADRAGSQERKVMAAVDLAEALFYVGTGGARQRCRDLAQAAAATAGKTGQQEWRLRAEICSCLEDALLDRGDGPARLDALFTEATRARLPVVAASAEAWAVQARRLRKGVLDRQRTSDTVTLEAEFFGQHQDARLAWDTAASPQILEAVAAQFASLADSRLSMGAAPGACDSLNQQGVVLMRRADWPATPFANPDVGQFDAARSAIVRSCELARDCGLRRQQYSADMTLACLNVRFPPRGGIRRGFGDIKTGYSDVLSTDRQEQSRVRIASLLEELRYGGTAVVDGVAASFEALLGTGREGLSARLESVARVNARVLRTWQRGGQFQGVLASEVSALLGTDPQRLSPYWQERLRALQSAPSVQTDRHLQDVLWLLLDPFPPNPLT